MAYLDDMSPSGTLILTVSSWDKRIRLHKKFQKTGGLIEVSRMYSNQLPGYITSYAQQTHAIRLDGRTSRFLVELVGDDPGRLCREMDKLAVYVAPRKTAFARSATYRSNRPMETLFSGSLNFLPTVQRS